MATSGVTFSWVWAYCWSLRSIISSRSCTRYSAVIGTRRTSFYAAQEGEPARYPIPARLGNSGARLTPVGICEFTPLPVGHPVYKAGRVSTCRKYAHLHEGKK